MSIIWLISSSEFVITEIVAFSLFRLICQIFTRFVTIMQFFLSEPMNQELSMFIDYCI